MTNPDIDRLNALHDNPRAIQLWRALLPLQSCVSFMNTGAHPDDETTSMLAALGLRDGVKLSQACANRGEGGQNAIGAEITRDLGAIRTREMERAAQAINMTHYWLSQTPEDKIFDFGFSKSGSETLEKWGEQRTLERFVLILRRERPDIVCPTFLDISGQHGHHQAMTRSAFKAVQLAADPGAFPQQGLEPWQVKKVYLPAWSGAGDAYDDDVPPPRATTVVDATGGDDILGADYAQIAQYSRSFHRTQGMGRWVEPGSGAYFPLHLAWSADGQTPDEASIFAGLPHTLADLATFAKAPELTQSLAAAQTAIAATLAAWPDYGAVRGRARRACQELAVALADCPPAATGEVAHRLQDKQRQLARVLALAGDLRHRVSLSTSEVCAGDSFELTLHHYAPGLDLDAQVRLPGGWQATDWQGDTCRITVPADAAASDPYPDTWFCDRANAPLHVIVSWREGEQDVWIGVDPEQRLQVLPPRSAALSQSNAVLNLQEPGDIAFEVGRVTPAGAAVAMAPVAGWRTTGNGTSLRLTPEVAPQQGMHDFAVLLDGKPAQSVRRMAYPHIGKTMRCVPARLRVSVMDVRLPTGRIAYIGGGNDRTDFWLRKCGMTLDCLSPEALRDVDLGRYDSILIGIFAMRTCATLANRLADLHDWVRAGGNLVTLYHRPWDNWDAQNTALAFLEIGKPSLRWRVTDENAAVTHLLADHPLLNTPNRIGPRDWQGWDKERGLYFAKDWDKAYDALLEMADADEAPLRGALLSGRFGRGRHSHTSLILHHQVANLVPGAFRLLANLLDAP
jgi:LmbE family N-acetylglucosaminyl deacetylase